MSALSRRDSFGYNYHASTFKLAANLWETRRGLVDLTKLFEIIDHTADIGINAYGRTLKDLFSNAATALFSLISDTEQVQAIETRTVSVSAPDRESLLVRWLNELIYLWDTEHLLLSRFKIARLTSHRLDAECSGERLDPSRHRVHRDVKAATYHMLQINRDSQGYQTRIIFDI